MKEKSIKRIKISGHRGFKAKEIENTKKAVERAIQNKIDYVEVDLRKTQDNRIVVFHDKRVHRLLNGKGKVKDYTLENLKSLTYADGQSILTAEELFNLTKQQIKVILDVKSENIEEKLISLIDNYDLNTQVIIQSKSWKFIERCFNLAPSLDYALYKSYIGKLPILGRIERIQKKMAQFCYNVSIKPYPIDYMSLDGPFMYNEILNILKKNGIKIILGAMMTEYFLKNIQEWHVDIINANDPVKIRNILEHKTKKRE